MIAHDEEITERFFFKECRPLFISILRQVFNYEVDYDECVNELYLHLMENDASRLRQFEGRSSLYSWLKTVAIRFFIAKRRNIVDNESSNSYDERIATPSTSNNTPSSRMDVERLLGQMPNRRYVYVIRRLILQDAEPQKVAAELDISVDNLYNIKKRAMAALTEMALNDIRLYEKGRSR